MTVVNEAKPQFEKVIERLSQELSTIRTGRATPALLEMIRVEVYGAQQPVKAVASISVPDAKTLVIEPWDASTVSAIESAIMKSDLGITPNVDGKIIRLSMPMMTEETRQRMVKVVKEKMEEARISVRQVREEARKKIDKLEGVGEDDKRRLQDELEKEVKAQNEEIERMGKEKEEDVMKV